MHPRTFRLLETLQRVDHALRREQRRRTSRDPEIIRLNAVKRRARDLIHRLLGKRARL